MSKQFNSVKTKIMTVKGELAGFNCFQKPNTKYNPEGAYQANILISKEVGVKLAKELKKINSEQFKAHGKGTTVVYYKSCEPFIKKEINEDGEIIKETPDADGRYLFKTTAKAYIENGKPNKIIPIFDTKNKAVSDVRIGNGSTVVLSFAFEGYSIGGKTGVSVRLKAVQLIDLIEYGTMSAKCYGFGEEEGFMVETREEDEATDNTDEEDF